MNTGKYTNRIKELYKTLDKKTRRYMVIIGVITVLFQGADIVNNAGESGITDEDLRLPLYGEEYVTLPLHVRFKNNRGEVNRFNTVIELAPRTYNKEEAEKILEYAALQLREIVLGCNESLENVRDDLNMVERIDNLPVSITWYSTDYDVISARGTVNNYGFLEGQSKCITLFALISCGTYSKEIAMEVTVVSRNMNEEEAVVADINRLINESIVKSQEYAELPREYNGGTISYYKVRESQEYTFLILGLAAMLVVLLGNHKQKERQQKVRTEQLKLDYSEVISKFTLLMGAGMTIQRAWEKIVNDYKNTFTGENTRYVYEEMWESYNQMKAGMPETQVYEEFGKRCKEKEYQKFSTLIVQNLKKGTKDLAALLELEVIEAFEQRKNMARVKGEEAGTKLLVPMVIMLVIVMIIVMVPAIMTFEM